MGFIELFLIGISLSMDAFAVSICKGLSLQNIKWKHMVSAGLWFGGFQALMPAIGYFFGSFFTEWIQNLAPYIAFALLAIIGVNMIIEAFGEEEEVDASMDVKTMFLLAIATSIDALAVGVTFAFMEVNIIISILLIGITTFMFSLIGIKIGSLFGSRYKSKAECVGGIVLVLIGLKILLEGIGIIG